MRVALVANAAAGSFPPGGADAALRDHLSAAGVTVAASPGAELPLPERMRAAASVPGIDAVVVAGGDGTMACAASVLAGRSLPLGLVPMGTMNLLAKDLGLPLDLPGAAAAIGAGRARRIDVGEVNGEIFLINSVLGMPARMARHREAQRGREGLAGALRMAAGLFRHAGRYPRLAATVAIDGSTRHGRFGALVIVNNDYDEAPGRFLTRTRPDGGRLTLYLLPRLSSWRVLRLGAGFALGAWRGLPGLERHPVEELTISTKAHSLRVMNDGEVLLATPPLRYRIHRRALAVLVPADAAGAGAGDTTG